MGDRKTRNIAIAIDTILKQKQINAQNTSDSEKLYCVGSNWIELFNRGTIGKYYFRSKWFRISYYCSNHCLTSYSFAIIGTILKLQGYFQNNGMHALIIYDDPS